MKVLVLGSGGREHSIIRTLNKTSSAALKLYCAPGNAGISESAQCVPISPEDHSALIQFAQSEGIGLTIVGPEAPLAKGVVDEFESHELSIFGPSRAAARLESSKSFAKDFMVRNKIPTAGYRVAGSLAEAFRYLQSGEFGSPDSPVVIKADGLAAGKGVIVANSRAQAKKAVERLMTGDLVVSEAAKQVVIEEALQGREASVLVFSDGHDYALMPPARDHKRLGENDTGPNTGGMGAITDASILDNHMLDRIVREIVEPALEGARAEGFPFRGVLFVGVMLTADGPKVLEYNVRFGDPETQAILPRLKSDLVDVMLASVEGRMKDIKLDLPIEINFSSLAA